MGRSDTIGIAYERTIRTIELTEIGREEGIGIAEAELPEVIGIFRLRALRGTHDAGLRLSSAG